MSKKNKAPEDASSLFAKALDALDNHRVGLAENTLDAADDKKLSDNMYIQTARAMWCLRTARNEEAVALALAVCEKKPSDPHLVNALSTVLQMFGQWDELRELYARAIPTLAPGTDKPVVENLVVCNAQAQQFRDMQRHAQDLGKRFKQEPRYLVWAVFAFLMQIPNRRSTDDPALREAARDSLFYKLALKTLETHVINNSSGSSGVVNHGVANIYVDVMESQRKLKEAVDFLFSEQGKTFGSWTERVAKCANLLRQDESTKPEANAMMRHLWTKVDPDRWDWFEAYRDTLSSPAVGYTSAVQQPSSSSAAPAAAAASTTADGNKSSGNTNTKKGKKGSNNPKDQQQQSEPQQQQQLVCEPGKTNMKELFEDVLRLVDEKSKKTEGGGAAAPPQSRVPRLAAIALASSTSSSPSPLCSAEKRTELIVEHATKLGTKKSLPFLDLVKYLRPTDAAALDTVAPVLAGYCRRAELAASDDKTEAFVNKCLSDWVAPASKTTTSAEEMEEAAEAAAIASDASILAATTACIRRAQLLSSSSSGSSLPSSSSSLLWLEKAAAIAHHALEQYSPHLPHISFLSALLHAKIGSSDLDSVQNLDIKSVQHESMPCILRVAVQQRDLATVTNLASNAANRMYRQLTYDSNRLIDKGMQHFAFHSFEEVFDTQRKMLQSAARAQLLSFDVLLNECIGSETAAEMRGKLLMHRREMAELLSRPTEEYTSQEDRVQLFGVILHAEPASAEFTSMVDFLLGDDNNSKKETTKHQKGVELAKNIAGILLALECISGESASAKSQSRCLKPTDPPTAELQKIVTSASSCCCWSWVSNLVSAIPVFLATKTKEKQQLDKQAATAEATKLLTDCAKFVEGIKAEEVLLCDTTASASATATTSALFLFPVLQLIVLSARVICDRQPQGVKAAVVALKEALSGLVDRAAAAGDSLTATTTQQKNESADDVGTSQLRQLVKKHADVVHQRRVARFKRESIILEGAAKAIGVLEKLVK